MRKTNEKCRPTGKHETINGITYPICKDIQTGYEYIEINRLHYPTGMTPLQEKLHRKFGIGSKFAKVGAILATFSMIAALGYAECRGSANSEPQKTQPAQVDNTSQGLEQIVE